MLFNSTDFFIFLPTVFCLYWFVFQKKLKLQNLLLLISSYVFLRLVGLLEIFLYLIFSSTIVDYFVGLKIHDINDKNKKVVSVDKYSLTLVFWGFLNIPTSLLIHGLIYLALLDSRKKYMDIKCHSPGWDIILYLSDHVLFY